MAFGRLATTFLGRTQLNGTNRMKRNGKRIGHPVRLRNRADFVAMRGARRFRGTAFSLQARERPESGLAGCDARYGVTVTSRIGGAVQRNRIRRRLWEALREAGGLGLCRHDYVVVAEPRALTLDFRLLVGELARGLEYLSRPRGKDRNCAGLSGNTKRRTGAGPSTPAGKRT